MSIDDLIAALAYDTSEDPEDRRVREAHGFTLEDDFQDPAVVCATCRRSYSEIAAAKIEACDPERV